jgi:error-prone DNA polymerase
MSRRARPRYVELRCHSAFSFLRGASNPEDLVHQAKELGHDALALTDCDGVYGAPRFYKAARACGLRALVGADLAMEGDERLLVLCRDRQGYRNLCRLITEGKLRYPKGESRVRADDVAAHAEGLLALTGGLHHDRERLARWASVFGPGNLFVEVGRHLVREEEPENERRVALARALRLPVVATNDVRYHTAARACLFDVMTCIHQKTTLDAAGSRLERNAERRLKSALEMAALFSDLPEAVEGTVRVAERCAFTLEDLGYRFPDYPVPPGETAFSYLHQLTYAGARERYRPLTAQAARQLARELDLIDKLGLAGYFLIVWDLVRFCREKGILVQGRGSAANSAVCYSLGITAVDPVGMDLLFERFLSEERGEWPDIDLDLPSGDDREEVIQYVYRRYGERGAAMTANVITYRGRSAARDVGKALGFSLEQLDRVSRLWRGYGFHESIEHLSRDLAQAGLDPQDARVQLLVQLCQQIEGLPRHLGQHSGGMVIAAGRLDDVVPLEPATMPGRVVVQWDKEDCADLGIIKVDLLGLGMMALLAEAVPLVREHDGVDIDLAHLPPGDPKVYEMLCAADTVGVFQVESRAQMATLPRMKPRRFYDIVVEVAIIRPGPIVGKMVHPYLNRRAGREPVRYAHPLLEPILRRTLGVPIFQEQLMRMAMAVAGFTGGQAEELRRAMGFKRSAERMQAIERNLRAGMEARGIPPAAQEEIAQQIASFALYGFPESHAASFALLVYASAYLKAHHPAAFYSAILNQWPMGFYHPATLVKDAVRHGIEVRPIDVNASRWRCTVEEGAVRLGLRYVRGMGEAAGKAVEAGRPYVSVADLMARAPLSREVLSVLSEIGAFASLGLGRREALWQATAVAREGTGLFAGVSPDDGPAEVPPMTRVEETRADYRGTGMTTGPHPMTYLRERLRREGVRAAVDLPGGRPGAWVKTAGMVIVRQRPGAAKGFVFLTLEDETGLANVIIEPDTFEAHRKEVVTSPLLLVEGRLQNQDGVVSVKAYRFRAIAGLPVGESRDFH